MTRRSILFLCTGNSCRSQMAEAWCRALKSDLYQAHSAGTIAKGLDPTMIQVMREVGFEDPPELERTAASPEEALGHYRRVRDQIRDFINHLPGSLP